MSSAFYLSPAAALSSHLHSCRDADGAGGVIDVIRYRDQTNALTIHGVHDSILASSLLNKKRPGVWVEVVSALVETLER